LSKRIHADRDTAPSRGPSMPASSQSRTAIGLYHMSPNIPESGACPIRSEPAHESGKGGISAITLSPFIVAFLYLAYWQIAPRIPASSIGAIAISTIIALALGIWLPAQLGFKLRLSPGWVLVNLLAAAAFTLPVVLSVVVRHRIPSPWVVMLYVPGLPFLGLIWLAASLGALLSFLVRGANMIPPIAAVLALVDIWTVLLGGPVQRLMQSDDPTAHAVSRVLTVPLATPKQPRGATPMQGSVGFADFLFVAFFAAAIGRFSPDRRTYLRTLLGLIVVLSAYMLVVLFKEVNLPALVPMAVTMIAVHWRLFHYERSELYAMVYAALFIALIAAGLWFFGRQHSDPKADASTSIRFAPAASPV